MSHTLDLSKLDEIFEELEENAEKLSSWEQDRLEEWSAKYKASKGKWVPSERQCEIIEEMWQKV
jgi:hypothetical protein